MAVWGLFIEGEQSGDVSFVSQEFFTLQSFHSEFDEEIDEDFLGAEGVNEIDCRFHRTSCRE